MPTIFENEMILADGSVGFITTTTDLSVWDCKNSEWSKAPKVILRNTLLFAMYYTKCFCIGEISPAETDPHLLDPFKVPGNSDNYFLDLASNSRTHGRFTFKDKTTVGKLYFGQTASEQWKRIIYGSIVHTGCKKLSYKLMRYVVVDDENRDANGNYLDDPINNYHWKTGDSHAKASAELMQLIGLPATEELPEDKLNRPVQFRASEFGKWVGKGTIAYNRDLDGSGYDLAIPLSSLKGNKPALGNYEGKLLIGVVFEAEERRAKPGWMLFQWFDFATLEQDSIISKLMEKCDRLSKAYNSITELANILRIDQSEAEEELSNNPDAPMSEAEYVNTMIRIIKVDKHGQLLLHPYVVEQVQQRLQKVWLNLAKAAGVRFYSVMCMPDEALAHYHQVLPDGRIVGDRVFCAPDFPTGEYIVFCNPMRHWGDVQLWQNKHEGAFVKSTGIMAAPRLLLLNLGRDTDGDFIQLIRSSEYPNMREAIAAFQPSPITKKFPKMPLSGNLQQIAIKSMNDMTGVVASLLAKARAVSAEQLVLLIPAGGEQKTAQEMKIIEFLSQELQIAVDSLKSAYPNNVNGLNAVTEFLANVDAQIPWLKDLKNPDCYKSRPCTIKPGAADTVSRIIETVNSYWRPADLKIELSPKVYENVLFSNVTVTPEQLDYALEVRDRYRQEIAAAIEWMQNNEFDTSKIRQVSEFYRSLIPEIMARLSPLGAPYSPKSWVAAFWRVTHQAATGRASMVFTMFADEIIDELKNMPVQPAKVLKVFNVHQGSWSHPQNQRWSGQEVQIQIYLKEHYGKNVPAVMMQYPGARSQTGWHHLGLVADKDKGFVVPGETRTMLIYSTRFKNGQTVDETLFDPTMTQAEIDEFLNFK